MFSSMIFWPWFVGLSVLAIGMFTARKAISTGQWVDRLLALGRPIYGASLAAFGAEHFSNFRGVSSVLPAWFPLHAFWIYLVGACLLLGGTSIALNIRTRLAGTLAGIMFFGFVAIIHVPNALANPNSRLLWTIALRDLSFAGGAFALAPRKAFLRWAVRIFVGVPLLFFATGYAMHPDLAPGVPLAKETPNWFPMRILCGYLSAIGLAIAGASLLIGQERIARTSLALLGALVILFVAVLYLPLFLTAAPAGLLEGINYVVDTALFGGVVLLAARSSKV